jgi:hypothetical protein
MTLLSLTHYGSNRIIDRELRGQAYSPPASHFFALLTSTTGERQSSHLYALDDTLHVLADDGLVHLYKVTTGGTSAAAQGALYPGAASEVISDGAAVMTEQTAALDAGTGQVEPVGSAYAREEVVSSLANWLDTAGTGGGVASSGNSQTISNVNPINWGAASGGDWGFVWGVADYDSSSGGNPIAWGPLSVAVEVSDGNTFAVDAGELSIYCAGAFTTYLGNKLLDWLWRGQVRTAPSSVYAALMTATGTAGSAGTEVAAVGGYARPAIACNAASWEDTQNAGGGVASSGTTDETETEADTTWPTPSADWGTVTAMELYDALSGGNRLWWSALNAAKTLLAGQPVVAAAGAIKVKVR